MTPLDSLILGLVEGFTEFLPISSTAHLIMTSHILGLGQTAFMKTFEIAIQSGAILAVVIFYWRKFLEWEILKKIIVAFIPTAVIGLILYKFAKTYLLGNLYVVLGALFIGGIILIIFELVLKSKQRRVSGAVVGEGGQTTGNANATLSHLQKVVEGDLSAANGDNTAGGDEGANGIKSLSYTKAALIGVAQAVAIIPGVSRSGATIVGGLLAGMSRAAIVEFSFLLAAPTIAAATVLDLYKNAGAFTADQTTSFVIGFIAALVTAFIGIKFLLSYVKNKSFVGFGVYRIVLVVVFIAFLL